MKITDVRIRRVASSGKMKAVASITIDGVFVVHDIKVIEGEKGLFVAMPSKKTADGEYRDIAHPINTETRTMMEEMILRKYQEDLEKGEEPGFLRGFSHSGRLAAGSGNGLQYGRKEQPRRAAAALL